MMSGYILDEILISGESSDHSSDYQLIISCSDEADMFVCFTADDRKEVPNPAIKA